MDDYSPSDGSYVFGTRTRFVLMVIVLFSLTAVWSNIIAFNFALICIDHSNATESIAFSKSEESWFTSSVALAAVAANIPVTVLVHRVGIRMLFSSLGLLSSLATLLMPTAIRSGFGYVVAARALQGLAFAGNFPVIGGFCSRWTYFKQTGLFVSFLVSYVQLAPALTMPISGMLCATFSWSSVFYAHGAATLCVFALYGGFYRNSPHKHPLVGPVETEKIMKGKSMSTHKTTSLPLRAILSTPAVWGTWFAAVGNFFVVNLTFLFSPVYLSAVLGMSMRTTGITSALPPLAQFATKILFGMLSDRLKSVREVTKFRVFNSLSFCGCALSFTILAFMDDSHKTVNLLLLGLATGMLGAATGGFYKAAPFLSKQYSHFVTGNFSLVLTATMFTVPFVVNSLTPNNAIDEWRTVFLATAAIQVISNVVFCIFIQGEPCEWTNE